MNNLRSFHEVLETIEQNLTRKIDITELAKKANMSVYEFRRIFSFVTGVPISEYIRKRRLSCAAADLLTQKISVSEAALRYGYDTPSSFSRAFKEFHGFAPNEIGKARNNAVMFTRIGFELGITGGLDIPYRIMEDTEFAVSGISGCSDLEDAECCENVWNGFYESPDADSILERAGEKLYAVYRNGENSVMCHIGARGTAESDAEKISAAVCLVPAAKWACFTLTGTEDAKTNEFYNNVLYRWLESVNYVRDNSVPNIEVFPTDMAEDDFEWEIRIPIRTAEAAEGEGK